MSLKTALTAKIWTIALTLDIKVSNNFLNLLINLSRICSHPKIYGSRYLCVRYSKVKTLPYSFLPRSTYIIKWFARTVPKLGTIKRTTMCIETSGGNIRIVHNILIYQTIYLREQIHVLTHGDVKIFPLFATNVSEWKWLYFALIVT